jgi:hypothetical protein
MQSTVPLFPPIFADPRRFPMFQRQRRLQHPARKEHEHEGERARVLARVLRDRNKWEFSSHSILSLVILPRPFLSSGVSAGFTVVSNDTCPTL